MWTKVRQLRQLCRTIAGVFLFALCAQRGFVGMFAVRPKGEAVDWLATECKKLRKNNVALPFPFAALKKWIPPYAENLRSEVSVMRCTRVSAWRASVPLLDESSEDGIMSMAL